MQLGLPAIHMQIPPRNAQYLFNHNFNSHLVDLQTAKAPSAAATALVVVIITAASTAAVMQPPINQGERVRGAV